jgi:hypothetical protein
MTNMQTQVFFYSQVFSYSQVFFYFQLLLEWRFELDVAMDGALNLMLPWMAL